MPHFATTTCPSVRVLKGRMGRASTTHAAFKESSGKAEFHPGRPDMVWVSCPRVLAQVRAVLLGE